MIILVDNYDSFTYNLYQLFGEIGEKVVVFRNDEVNKEISIDKIKSVMENVHLNFKNFEVPLLVDYGSGNNWGDAH